MPKKKDILLIAAIVLVAVLMLAASQWLPKTDLSTKTADVTLAPDAVTYLDGTLAPTSLPEQTAAPEASAVPEAIAEPDATAVPEVTAAPEETDTPEQADGQQTAGAQNAMVGPMPPKQAEKVRGYVVLTVAGRQYGDPIAMDREKVITLRQEDGKVNQVHITPETVYMEYSTCENQDCVGQGEIHVDHYQDRILGTYVICLPNSVTIEMVPAE